VRYFGAIALKTFRCNFSNFEYSNYQTEKLTMEQHIEPSAQDNDLNAGKMRLAITWQDAF